MLMVIIGGLLLLLGLAVLAGNGLSRTILAHNREAHDRHPHLGPRPAQSMLGVKLFGAAAVVIGIVFVVGGVSG
jgi:hypothetical protein